jgi:hypothetical protein
LFSFHHEQYKDERNKQRLPFEFFSEPILLGLLGLLEFLPGEFGLIGLFDG